MHALEAQALVGLGGGELGTREGNFEIVAAKGAELRGGLELQADDAVEAPLLQRHPRSRLVATKSMWPCSCGGARLGAKRIQLSRANETAQAAPLAEMLKQLALLLRLPTKLCLAPRQLPSQLRRSTLGGG